MCLTACGGGHSDPDAGAADAGGIDRAGLVLDLAAAQRSVAPGAVVETELRLWRVAAGDAAGGTVTIDLLRDDGTAVSTTAADILLPAGQASAASQAVIGLPSLGVYRLHAALDLGDGMAPLEAGIRVAARDQVGVVPDDILAYSETPVDAAAVAASTAGGVITLPGPNGSVDVAIDAVDSTSVDGAMTIEGSHATLLIADGMIAGYATQPDNTEIYWEPLRWHDPTADPSATLVYSSQDLADAGDTHDGSDPEGPSLRADDLRPRHAWLRPAVPPAPYPPVPIALLGDYTPSDYMDSPQALFVYVRDTIRDQTGVSLFLSQFEHVDGATPEGAAVLAATTPSALLSALHTRYTPKLARPARIVLFGRTAQGIPATGTLGWAYLGGPAAWASVRKDLSLARKIQVALQEIAHTLGARHDCSYTGAGPSSTVHGNAMFSYGQAPDYCDRLTYGTPTLTLTDSSVSEIRCGAVKRHGRQWAISEICGDGIDSDCNGNDDSAGPPDDPGGVYDVPCSTSCAIDLDCSDLLACNGAERCVQNTCTPLPPASEPPPSTCTEALQITSLTPTSVPPAIDAAVTIDGVGFATAPTPRVRIDGALVPITASSASQLTITIPGAMLPPNSVVSIEVENPPILGWGGAGAPATLDVGPPSCGDALCTGAETPVNCPADCPDACGDALCTGAETPSSCPDDCPDFCGDALCSGTENPTSCAADCPDACGDALCTGVETPINCAADCPDICGDALCSGTETALSCAADCPQICGDGLCTGSETSSTCLGDCPRVWSIVPAPSDSPTTTLRGVWAVASGEAFAAADAGVYDVALGASPYLAEGPANRSGIWATNASDVWAVGSAIFQHRDATAAWTGYTSGYSDSIAWYGGVWGSSGTDVWAAGNSYGAGGYRQASVQHWDGSAWTEITTPWRGTTTSYEVAAGTGTNDVWFGGFGSSGILAHWDGATWESGYILYPDGTDTTNITSMWAIAPDDVWAVVHSNLYGPLLMHYQGAAWSYTGDDWTQVPLSSGIVPEAVWASGPSDVWIVGDGGAILHWDGSSLVQVASPTTSNLRAIHGHDATDVWAVGDAGTIVHFGGT